MSHTDSQSPAATLEDLMAVQDQKAELIDGAIVMMAPVSAEHSLAQAKLANLLNSVTKPWPKGPSGWWLLTEAWTHYTDTQSFSHDLAAFDRQKLNKLPRKDPIRARPEWVCEIMSPSNWAADTQKKRRVLELARVPYYWIVDTERSQIMIFQLLNSEHYELVHCATPEDGLIKLVPFDEPFTVAEIFDH